MKKVIACIAFLIGLALVICEVSTDDFYVMQLHQDHTLNWLQIVIGILMCIPFPVVVNKEDKYGSRKAF